MSVTIVTTARLRPGAESRALEAARAIAADALADPGCLEYRFALDITDPATLVAIERWESDVHLEEHVGHDHTVEFLQKVGDAVTEAPRVARSTSL